MDRRGWNISERAKLGDVGDMYSIELGSRRSTTSEVTPSLKKIFADDYPQSSSTFYLDTSASC